MRQEIARLKEQLQLKNGDVDENTLEKWAQMGLKEREEEKRVETDEKEREVAAERRSYV